MRFLRQSTATVIEVGPFVDDTDGKTLEEALTVASIDVQLMQPTDTAAVPPDRVANGTFTTDVSWTKGTGWDINSTTALKAHHATGTSSDLEQTPAIALVQNVAYELTFTVSGITAGDVTPKIGGTSGTLRSTNATFTETIIAGSGALLEFTASSTFVGDLDDVIVKQVPIPITPAASGSTNDMVLTQSNTGTYWLELTANQVGVVGRHKLTAFISGALIVWEEFMVLEEAIFDEFYITGSALDTAADFVNEWETQSQADPTGFHVNVLEVSGTGQTANDNGADINSIKATVEAIPTTAMRGTDSAALASVCTEPRLAELDAANIPAGVDAIPTTAMRGTDSAALASVATEARLAELDAANLPAGVDAAVALFTTQLTEAYAADGVAPTPAQALFLIQQMLTEFAIAGTVNTVKKLDGATTAATMTLDDATNPTSSTRAT